MNRSDGRIGNTTLRPLSCETSCLHRADGSAKLSCGSRKETEVLVAVFGPISPKNIIKENPNEACISVIWKHASKQMATTAAASSNGKGNYQSFSAGYGCTERELERFIGEVASYCVLLKKFPRTIIEIVVQVIKSDGSVLATALNATIIALMDAGIPMSSLAIATTCLIHNPSSSDNTILLDPTAQEEVDDKYSVAVIVTEGNNPFQSDDGIISSMSFRPMSPESFLSCIDVASQASKAVADGVIIK